MNRNRWMMIAVVAALALLGGLGYYSRYLANRATPPPAKVAKKAAEPIIKWRVGQLEYKVAALQHEVATLKGRVTQLEKQVAAPAPAPALLTPNVGTPTQPKADVGAATPKPDNGWHYVTTDGRTLRLGTSTVPPPKVPVKPAPEGPDIR